MRALRHPLYASVWAGSTLSNIGAMIQVVGGTWMLATLTASPLIVALVTMASALPIPLFGLLGGSIADLYNRRLILLYSQIFMFAVSVILTALAFAGWAHAWVLILATFLLGSASAFNNPAWHASVNDLVPREDMPEAVALNSVGFNFGRTVGPAVGGILVTLAGPAVCFAVNAFSYIGLLTTLAARRWPVEERAHHEPARQPLGEAMREGLQYVWYSPVRGIALRAFHFGLAGSAIWALTPIVARDLLAGGGDLYGFLLGFFGAGAVVGAMVNRRLRGFTSLNGLVMGSVMTFCVSLTIVGLSRSAWLTMPATFACGACWVSGVSSLNMSVQMSAARWVVARSLSIYQGAIYAGMALGSWLWGTLAEIIGMSAVLGASALAMALLAPLLRLFPLPGIGPDRRALSPSVAARTVTAPPAGPVQVTIEYRIDPAEAAAFLAAIHRKRRLRLRDGAQDWRLLQDLHDPAQFSEQYTCANWALFCRLRERRLEEDGAIEQAVTAFHSDAAAPRVRVQRLDQPTSRADEGHSEAADRLLADAIPHQPSVTPHASGSTYEKTAFLRDFRAILRR